MGNGTLIHDVKVEGGKGLIAVIGGVLSAVTLNEWVAIATLVYIVIQAFVLLEKRHWAVQDRKNGIISADDPKKKRKKK